MSKLTLEQFLKQVQNHKMTVLLDSGTHRHLLFSQGGSYQRFNVITYPGALVISGDMGCFVFQRTEDMFDFFRDNGRWKNIINAGYWAEKVVAGNFFDWDQDEFDESIKETLQEWVEDAKREGMDEAFICEQEEKVSDHFGCISGEIDSRSSVHHWQTCDNGVEFDELEGNFTKHTERYLWCCHAIVWAIAEYDKAKA